MVWDVKMVFSALCVPGHVAQCLGVRRLYVGGCDVNWAGGCRSV